MEKQFDEKEALALIDGMIHSAKSEIRDNGFYFMFWGYLVFVSALTDYVMLMFMQSEYHAIVWAILMPFGGLVSTIGAIRKSAKPKRVKTYVDDMMKTAAWAFVISLLVVCLIMPMQENTWRAFYPVLMVLYALWLFIAGGALRFKPLLIGGIVNWAAALAAFFAGYDNQLLLLAMAVLAGYIIPGHLLNRRAAAHV